MTYSAKDIKTLEGLEPVRVHPGMYIGTTDKSGLFQIIKEAIDNAIDEALAGYNDTVGVHISSDGQVYVWDSGRGIPVEKHKTGKSALQVIMTTLHAGSKSSEQGTAYSKGSRGVHGVGISVTNALSEHLTVFTFRNGVWYNQSYKKGIVTGKVASGKRPPKIPSVPLKKGTLIVFRPDKTIFKSVSIPLDRVQELLELSSYLTPKLKCYYVSPKGKLTKYYHPKGAVDLLNKMLEDSKSERIGRSNFEHSRNGVDVVFQWSSSDEDGLQSYVCGSRTIADGTHVQGFNKALMEAIKPHAGRSTFRLEDLRVGLQGILNLTIRKPRFASQTKDKLATEEATKQVYDELIGPLKKFFNSNKSVTKDIIRRAAAIREAVAQFNVDKKLAAEFKTEGRGKVKPPKDLFQAKTNDPNKRELYLVEGGSASGTSRAARDQSYQEVLQLKGKPINAYKAQNSKLLSNEVVANVLKSIGVDFSLKDPLANIRTKKIILLPDADEDGNHITVLLLSLLHKVAPRLFELGYVYTIDAPLFNVWYKGERVFADTLNQLLSKYPKVNTTHIQRVKGWGEINSDALRELAFDPKSRRIWQIKAISKEETKAFVAIVGEEVTARRKLLGLI